MLCTVFFCTVKSFSMKRSNVNRHYTYYSIHIVCIRTQIRKLVPINVKYSTWNCKHASAHSLMTREYVKKIIYMQPTVSLYTHISLHCHIIVMFFKTERMSKRKRIPVTKMTSNVYCKFSNIHLFIYWIYIF